MNFDFEVTGEKESAGQPANISEEILALLQAKTKNPGEAFVLLQQLTIYVWDQFKIDWNKPDANQVTSNRKQRYLDYLTNLLDQLKNSHMLTQEIE